MLKARAFDADSFPLLRGVEFTWRLVDGQADLTADGDRCQVVSQQQDVVTIEVEAKQEGHLCTEEARIRFMNGNGTATPTPRRKGLPSYRLAPQADKQQRSYYDRYVNEIIINSAHQDFVDSNTSPARHRRYIGKLYAKEVVLLNFPDAPPAVVAERLIELMVRTEENL